MMEATMDSSIRRYPDIIKQDKYMCVAASLFMIFKRRGIDVGLTQFELGSRYLNLTINSVTDDISQFPEDINLKISCDPLDVGCHVNNLNKQLFIPLNLPFKEVFYNRDTILKRGLESYLKATIKDNRKDILLALNYKTLVGKDGIANHLMLVDRIEDNKVILKCTDKTEELSVDYQSIKNSILDKKYYGIWEINYLG